MSTQTNADYERGYKTAKSDIKDDLAATLRTLMVDTGEDGDEPLSNAQAREIFSGVFGVMASDQEFGTPSGAGAREAV